MSQMKGVMRLALASGLFVQMVVKIGQQRHGARKILWEAGKLTGGPKATVALNYDNHLFFSVTSVAGKRFSTPLVAPESTAGWFLLWCWLEHFSDDHSRLSIAVNGGIVAESNVDGGTVEDWGYESVEVTSSILDGIEGMNAVALHMAELVIAEGRPTRDELARMLAYIHGKYAIGPLKLSGHYS
jgi:hypothetical protein